MRRCEVDYIWYDFVRGDFSLFWFYSGVGFMSKNISIILFLFSVASLGGAYVSQYIFGLEPCILCLYQRIPFFVVLALSVFSLFVKNKPIKILLVSACGIALLVGAGIAFYHAGVENGMFETSGCSVDDVPSTIEEMTAQLMGKPNVPCDVPQFVFLGVSMAGWNFFFSSIVGLFALGITFRMWRRKK